MRRLFFTIVLSCGVLHASSTVVSSCTDGTTTLSPCSTDPTLASGGISGPGYLVNAYAGVYAFASSTSLDSVYFPNIPGGRELQALAETTTVFDPGPTSSVPTAATAQATQTLTFTSGGPARMGFIQLEAVLLYVHESQPGASDVTVTDGIDSYSYNGLPPGSSYCNQEICEYGATVPFELGVPFYVTVDASSDIVPNENEGGHQAEASVLFGLFDANGAPVQIITPEPATAGLLALSIAAAFGFYRRRRHG